MADERHKQNGSLVASLHTQQEKMYAEKDVRKREAMRILPSSYSMNRKHIPQSVYSVRLCG